MAPGALFAHLWQKVVLQIGPLISRPWDGRGAREYDDLHALLSSADGPDIPDEVAAYLAGGAVGFDCAVTDPLERAFVVMCALDHAAMLIHPAFPNRLPGLAAAVPGLLAEMKSERTINGCYANVEGIGLVVPKGHLTQRKRPDDHAEASGADLAHQFEHLTVIPQLPPGRTLRIIAPSPRKFLVTDDRIDRVGLAPIAEDSDDIEFRTSRRGERAYLDAIPTHADLPSRISGAVTRLLDDGAGVIVLPELVTGVGASEALTSILKARGSVATSALIVAGTGPSAQPDAASGRPHNEAVLMGADGRILALQRKLHFFNMAGDRMQECGIPFAAGCDAKSHMEDAAVGTELVVCDLHGLGRVMVLICEDLQQQAPGGDVALILRPDWILTPVLDTSLAEGRWMHGRGVEIGRKTLSRIVVSCSGTLGVRKAGKTKLADVTVNTGLCYDGFTYNRMKLITSAGAVSPERATLDWDVTSWPTHKVILEKA